MLFVYNVNQTSHCWDQRDGLWLCLTVNCTVHNYGLKLLRTVDPTWGCTRACICIRVCTFIGLWAKRTSNLITVPRVSTCDSRYIYKLLINILIDSQIMAIQADMGNCFNVYVFLVCVPTAWLTATIYNSWSKAESGLIWAWAYYSRPLTPCLRLCPLTTLTTAVRLISASSLITWNQTLKEGGRRSYS